MDELGDAIVVENVTFPKNRRNAADADDIWLMLLVILVLVPVVECECWEGNEWAVLITKDKPPPF